VIASSVSTGFEPCIGLDFNVEAARAHLRPEDADFFD
jgi:hypothetical protein